MAKHAHFCSWSPYGRMDSWVTITTIHTKICPTFSSQWGGHPHLLVNAYRSELLGKNREKEKRFDYYIYVWTSVVSWAVRLVSFHREENRNLREALSYQCWWKMEQVGTNRRDHFRALGLAGEKNLNETEIGWGATTGYNYFKWFNSVRG